MSSRSDYQRKLFLAQLNEFTLDNNLIQLVNFETWSRIINGVRKESTLDRAYVNNYALVANVNFEMPTFGDHVLIIVELKSTFEGQEKFEQKRNWSKYSPQSITTYLKQCLDQSSVSWANLNVTDHWYALEHIIVHCVDKFAPITNVCVNENVKHQKLPIHVKQKLNKRKRLLKQDKITKSTTHVPEIKVLNLEIKNFFATKRTERVLRAATGANANIWHAVRNAKKLNKIGIPSNLTCGGKPVAEGLVAQSFGSYFSSKIKFNNAHIDVNEIYNGKNKMIVQDRNFMTRKDVELCMSDLNNKKCEGYARSYVGLLLKFTL